jgi:hypothetical protein
VRDPVAVVLPILDPVDLQVDVPIVVDEVLQQLDRLTEVADGDRRRGRRTPRCAA